MNILITGVNGFVGRSFIKRLLDKKVNIVGIDIQKYPSSTGFEYLCIDITKPYFIKGHFDYIFHFAALSRTNVKTDYTYAEIDGINVTGTINTIRSCSFDKIVFLSSTLLYDRSTRYISESSPLKVAGYYSKTKYLAESVIEKTLAKDRYIILRPVNLVGENQDEVAAIPVFFKQAIHNEDIHIFVPPSKSMQFLHIDDFTDLLQRILARNIDGIFNVSSDETITIIELAKRIVDICQSKSRIICSHLSQDDLSIIGSGKIRRLTSWQPAIGISEILERFVKANYNISNSFMMGDDVTQVLK